MLTMTTTLMLALPEWSGTSSLVTLALITLTTVAVAGAALAVTSQRSRDASGSQHREGQATVPVPTEESERYVVARDERTAEDDVAERRRRQLAEAARDP